jgi:hypothetical protein
LINYVAGKLFPGCIIQKVRGNFIGYRLSLRKEFPIMNPATGLLSVPLTRRPQNDQNMISCAGFEAKQHETIPASIDAHDGGLFFSQFRICSRACETDL